MFEPYLTDSTIVTIEGALLPLRIVDDADATTREGQRRAAVLIPLIPRDEGWQVLLTKRPDTMPRHAGEISFPGGRTETGETSLQAALRETEEEVGIRKAQIYTLGRLDSFNAASSFRVTPYVGIVDPHAQIIPDAREVAEAFEVPLIHFMDSDNHIAREVEFKGTTLKLWDMPYTGADGIYRKVWGMTAMMLYRLYQRAYVGDFTHPDAF